jgi:hypothetical protein
MGKLAVAMERGRMASAAASPVWVDTPHPLALHCRDALLRILAHELRGRRGVGDGGLHRIARNNSLFDPPDLDGRMPRVSKWER